MLCTGHVPCEFRSLLRLNYYCLCLFKRGNILDGILQEKSVKNRPGELSGDTLPS